MEIHTVSTTGPTSANSEAKYQRLATEYAKLRAQASVLKKAVLEEQAKRAKLQDHIRQRETALRRAEQEVDSLGFRNKQLEQRVAALQDEVALKEGRRKHDKEQKRVGKTGPQSLIPAILSASDVVQDALIFEELQKKIMENAQLTSQNDDKERELLLQTERITSLEHTLEKRASEYGDLEKSLRRDLETLHNRNCELETKLVEAASMIGSEDALSASGSDNTPLHNSHQNHGNSMSLLAHTGEERIANLEKEVAHWRTHYEILKLRESLAIKNKDSNQLGVADVQGGVDANCGCSSTAAGITVVQCYPESKSDQRARESLKGLPKPATKEELIYNNFSKKFEDLLKAKCMAESRFRSFEVEVEHLQNCLENATEELKAKDEQMESINQSLKMLEDDLATTRVNYEEQISVLTEQVINLSDQLAACK